MRFRMIQTWAQRVLTGLVVVILLSGCPGGGGSANKPPVADAGADQQVDEQVLVTLDGSASYDSDGTIATYRWVQTDGLPVTLTGSETPHPSFTAPTLTTQQTLTFRLGVSDNAGLIASDTVSITIVPVNNAPTPNAGSDQNVPELSVVSLDGSASLDSDGTLVGYQWTQTGGTPVTLSAAESVQPHFTAPARVTAQTLTFELRVTDNEGASASAQVSVTVYPVNAAPQADAGSDQQVDEQTQVTLDGSASQDSDGSLVTYHWSQTAGSAVVLNNADTPQASFTAPTLTTATTLTFELRVTDNEGASATAPVNVTVNPINTPPIADAGSAQSVDVQTLVTLDATGSNDSDGAIVGYLWSQVSGPDVSLSSADSAQASFTTPLLGGTQDYVFQLEVTDNEGGSATSDVTISVTPLYPVVTMSDLSVAEGDGNHSVDITLQLSSTAGAGAAITYQTLDQTATAGNDYVALNGRVDLLSGSSSVTLHLTILGDDAIEGDEQLRLVLSAPAQLYLADSEMTLTVVDDDYPAASVNDLQLDEGDTQHTVFLTISLDKPAEGDVDLQVKSVDGGAIGGEDYVTVNDTYIIPSGTDTLQVPIEILGDLSPESDEGFSIELSDPSSNLVLGGQTSAAITLHNDDGELGVPNDTGVTYGGNYPSGNNADCSGETIARQDCSHGRDVTAADDSDGHAGFRFVKTDIDGNALPDDATDWNCIADKVTGLLWTRHSGNDGIVANQGLFDADDTYTWYDKFTGWGYQNEAATCSFFEFKLLGGADPVFENCYTTYWIGRMSYCGSSAWRLPTVDELLTLVDHSRTNPAIDTKYFPYTSNGNYWTSQRIPYECLSRVVSFGTGGVDVGLCNFTNHMRYVSDTHR